MVDLSNCITRQPVIRGVKVRYHGLYAGIAQRIAVARNKGNRYTVSQAFRPCCAPADIQHLLYFGIVAVKYSGTLEWITRESAINIIDCQRIIFSGYNDPEVAICAKIQRGV